MGGDLRVRRRVGPLTPLMLPGLLSVMLLPGILPGPAALKVAAQQRRRPVVYTTPPQPARGNVVIDLLTEVAASGQVMFTVTRANDDDTLSGTLQFALDPASRARIAEALKRTEVPATMGRTEVRARFRPGSACPVAHLELDPAMLEASGVRLQLPRLALTIIEDKDEMTPQLCFLARQINVGKMRRGVIAAINRLIRGDEPEAR